MNSSEMISWPYILATRQRQVSLSPLQAAEAEAALNHLRTLFGEDILAFPVRLQERLLNWAPWTYRWLNWFSASLHLVETARNYRSLARAPP